MKIRIGHLLILLLILLVAAPASGAMYDATGQWRIQADPGQELAFFDVSTDPITVEIEQFANDGYALYFVNPKKDVFLGGEVRENHYYLYVEAINKFYDPTLPLHQLDPITYGSFTLSSENELSGSIHFDFFYTVDPDTLKYTATTDIITFTGSKEVPVPAAVWLLGSGMAALFGIRHRAKA